MKQFKYLITAGVMLLLCACATAPVSQPMPAVQQEATDPTFAVATLAPLGSFEFQAAPAFTRNAILRHRSAALARAGKIDVATIEQAIRNCDSVRAKLDASLAADRAHDAVKANQLLNDASALISSAEVALNAGVK